ncbi:hypothetical protein M5K25_016846 [Dendrobium thyrsiflorum]|uniref:Uncharacterized protein n=1 Tax=Dendrobium thyrsiflorum TaxID=117978 RepID=A0ABD0UL94_DENTH
MDSVTVASFCRLSRTTVSAKSLVSSSVFPSGTSTIYDSSTTVHKPPPLSRSDSPNSVTDAVLAADDGESGDPLFFVEYVEPLGAGARRKAGDDSNLAKAADANLAAFHNGAAADKGKGTVAGVTPPGSTSGLTYSDPIGKNGKERIWGGRRKF